MKVFFNVSEYAYVNLNVELRESDGQDYGSMLTGRKRDDDVKLALTREDAVELRDQLNQLLDESSERLDERLRIRRGF